MTRQEQVRIEAQGSFTVLWKWIPTSINWLKIYHFGQKWPFHLVEASRCHREYDHNAS